jgi:hypothetical protein
MTRIVILMLALGTIFTTQAQTAEEIVETYFEVIGGKNNYEKLNQITFSGNAIQIMGPQQMEFPFNMYLKAPNKQRLDISFQGQTMTQMAYDGEAGWGINFMNMKAEKYSPEENEVTASQALFPDALLHYKKSGFKLELEEAETVSGTECHKIKLVKNPITINGEEKENEVYYFFDKESSVLLMTREYAIQGPMAGTAQETHISDYEEVDGIYFAHTMEIFVNGEKGFQMNTENIDLNTAIEDSFFSFPAVDSDSDSE